MARKVISCCVLLGLNASDKILEIPILSTVSNYNYNLFFTNIFVQSIAK